MSTGPTPTQTQRLLQIEEKLLAVFLDEADPDNWMNEEKAKEEAQRLIEEGEDPKAAAKLVSGWKGERYWEKKNANQTMALLTRIVTYRQRLNELAGAGTPPAADEEERLAKDMKEAQEKISKRLRLIKGRKAALGK